MDNPTRLFDFIYYQQTHFPQQRAFAFRHNGKEVSHFSTEKIIDMANAVSRGLLQMGLKSGDKIGTVIVKNRPEWTILDLGMMQIGVINVPVYPTIAPSDYEYIFNDAAVKLCFVGDDDAGSVFKKVEKAKENIPSLTTIFTFDAVNYAPFWEEIWQNFPPSGELKGDTEGSELDEILKSVGHFGTLPP